MYAEALKGLHAGSHGVRRNHYLMLIFAPHLAQHGLFVPHHTIPYVAEISLEKSAGARAITLTALCGCHILGISMPLSSVTLPNQSTRVYLSPAPSCSLPVSPSLSLCN